MDDVSPNLHNSCVHNVLHNIFTQCSTQYLYIMISMKNVYTMFHSIFSYDDFYAIFPKFWLNIFIQLLTQYFYKIFFSIFWHNFQHNILKKKITNALQLFKNHNEIFLNNFCSIFVHKIQVCTILYIFHLIFCCFNLILFSKSLFWNVGGSEASG